MQLKFVYKRLGYLQLKLVNYMDAKGTVIVIYKNMM